MSDVSSQFWTGTTGRALRGNTVAQVAMLYLVTSPPANVIGLYQLPLPVMVVDTGLSESEVRTALAKGKELAFCGYDETTETVYVPEMARFQLGAQLKPSDKRIVGVRRTLETMKNSPFYRDFVDKYGVLYHLNISPLEGALIEPVLQAPSLVRKSPGKQRYAYPAPFELWWLAFPAGRRVDKKKTCEEWGRAVERIKAGGRTLEEARDWLQARIEAFAASPRAQDVRYVKHPQRWLSYAQYDDDPAAWEENDGDGRRDSVRRESSPGRHHDRDYSGLPQVTNRPSADG